MSSSSSRRKISVSIGLLARNEESRLPDTLASLFRQTLFAELDRRGQRAEIWCVANACTDDTAAVAERLFHAQAATHPHAGGFLAHAVSVATPGKINAWNLFVHEISDRESHCLILMDADIRLGEDTTLWNLVLGLAEHHDAHVTIGEPVKDIALKPATSLRERISLATSRLTQSGSAQLTGQLYCIRADVARAIWLPRDLAACEDGFIKSLVCTDLLRRPVNPARIRRVDGASHVFEAYTTARAILKNQKRQMIGQTFVHVLVDKFLPAACVRHAANPGEVIHLLDETEPEWLRDLINRHVREARHFWRLFPEVCSFRLRRWSRLPAHRKFTHLPATLLGSAVTLIAAAMAYRALRGGNLGYWPQKPPRADRPPSPRLADPLDLVQPAPSA
jgi:glycosyltransferase involved in cell wall biosynthesis